VTSVQTITAPAKEWIAALTRLTPAMAGKKPVPILNNIVISPETSTVGGYNYETSAITRLSASEGRGAQFLVSWRWLLDAIRTTSGKTKDAPATVWIEGNKVGVTTCGYELYAEGADIADYPEIPVVEPDVESTLVPSVLRGALRRTGLAASQDETLPILNAVQINMEDGGIGLLATDRYRLASDYVSGHGTGSASFLLGRRTFKAIDRFLVGKSVQLGIHHESRRIIISTEAVTFTCLASDGDYPKIRSLFPAEVTGSFEVDRSVLLESARVALTMNERYSPCHIELFEEGAKVTFDFGLFGPSVSPTAAGGPVAGDGERIKFAMNPHYLVETLPQIETAKVRISYTKLPNPFLFTPEGVAASDDKVLKHLIMPVRMSS